MPYVAVAELARHQTANLTAVEIPIRVQVPSATPNKIGIFMYKITIPHKDAVNFLEYEYFGLYENPRRAYMLNDYLDKLDRINNNLILVNGRCLITNTTNVPTEVYYLKDEIHTQMGCAYKISKTKTDRYVYIELDCDEEHLLFLKLLLPSSLTKRIKKL